MPKNSKILVCDDDETLCYLLKEQLLEEGFSSTALRWQHNRSDQENIMTLLPDPNMKEVS
jgi:CheY-like chemotaxis protein